MDDEQIDVLVQRLISLYVTLGEKARLNRATLGKLVGVSGSRFSQVAKDPSGRMSVSMFLKMRQGCYAIQHALDSGDLPATAHRGKPQEQALEALSSRIQSM